MWYTYLYLILYWLAQTFEKSISLLNKPNTTNKINRLNDELQRAVIIVTFRTVSFSLSYNVCRFLRRGFNVQLVSRRVHLRVHLYLSPPPLPPPLLPPLHFFSFPLPNFTVSLRRLLSCIRVDSNSQINFSCLSTNHLNTRNERRKKI